MTWIQTASGRSVDLLSPLPSDIDFVVDIAGPLARTARFAAQVRSGPYSVAQHSVIGARCILRDFGDRDLALRFLLHDAHEAYIGDWSRPLQIALGHAASKAAAKFLSTGRAREIAAGEAAAIVENALRSLKRGLDTAILSAASLKPAGYLQERAVKEWDTRMLETERRIFLGSSTRAWDWDDNPPLTVKWPEPPRVWAWPDAADAFVDTLRKLCPTALSPAA